MKRSVIETHKYPKMYTEQEFSKDCSHRVSKKKHFSKSCIIIIEWLGIFLIKKKRVFFGKRTYLPVPVPVEGDGEGSEPGASQAKQALVV